MNQPLHELRQQFPPAERDIWDYRKQQRLLSLDEVAALAPKLHIVDDRIQYLDGIRADNYGRAMDISTVLREMPPEVVIDHIGEDVAAWLSIGNVIQGLNDAINQALESRLGYHIGALDTARLWYWRRLGDRPTKLVLAEYGLIQAMRSGALDDVDLPRTLRRGSADDVALSDARVNDYALVPLEVDLHDSNQIVGAPKGVDTRPREDLWYDIYLDAPTGFMLTYRGTPHAIAAVAMATPTELMILQLQGIKATRLDMNLPWGERAIGRVSARGLMPLDWRKVMVDVSEQLARNSSNVSLAIQAGENNSWRRPGSDGSEPHMTKEDGERSYDEPARRLGFTQRQDDPQGNWHRDINTL